MRDEYRVWPYIVQSLSTIAFSLGLHFGSHRVAGLVCCTQLAIGILYRFNLEKNS